MEYENFYNSQCHQYYNNLINSTNIVDLSSRLYNESNDKYISIKNFVENIKYDESWEESGKKTFEENISCITEQTENLSSYIQNNLYEACEIAINSLLETVKEIKTGQEILDSMFYNYHQHLNHEPTKEEKAYQKDKKSYVMCTTDAWDDWNTTKGKIEQEIIAKKNELAGKLTAVTTAVAQINGLVSFEKVCYKYISENGETYIEFIIRNGNYYLETGNGTEIVFDIDHISTELEAMDGFDLKDFYNKMYYGNASDRYVGKLIDKNGNPLTTSDVLKGIFDILWENPSKQQLIVPQITKNNQNKLKSPNSKFIPLLSDSEGIVYGRGSSSTDFMKGIEKYLEKISNIALFDSMDLNSKKIDTELGEGCQENTTKMFKNDYLTALTFATYNPLIHIGYGNKDVEDSKFCFNNGYKNCDWIEGDTACNGYLTDCRGFVGWTLLQAYNHTLTSFTPSELAPEKIKGQLTQPTTPFIDILGNIAGVEENAVLNVETFRKISDRHHGLRYNVKKILDPRQNKNGFELQAGDILTQDGSAHVYILLQVPPECNLDNASQILTTESSGGNSNRNSPLFGTDIRQPGIIPRNIASTYINNNNSSYISCDTICEQFGEQIYNILVSSTTNSSQTN